MALDINARRNLEITEKLRDKSKKGTLLWVLDKTSTSMGGRLLRRWLNDPLIDENEISTENIHVGSKVKIRDVEFDEICDYRIVGSNESDPDNGLISDESPIGGALLGHSVGDKVEVEAPAGIIEFEVLEISR